MKKIFLIEDNSDMLSLLNIIVKEIKCTVFTFKEAKLAYEKLQELKPDLVLCDLLMPEYNGFSFLNDVKSNPDLKIIPVIILSVVTEKYIIDKVKQLGADHFFPKPFRVAELLGIIKKNLGDE